MQIELQKLIGSKLDQCSAFFNSFGDSPVESNRQPGFNGSPDSYYLLLPACGWEAFIRDGRLTSLWLYSGLDEFTRKRYSTYDRRLPHEIAFHDLRADVLQKLGLASYSKERSELHGLSSSFRSHDAFEFDTHWFNVFYCIDSSHISRIALISSRPETPPNLDICAKCGAKLFRPTPGVTTTAEIVAYAKLIDNNAMAQEKWIHPGIYCPNRCISVLID